MRYQGEIYRPGPTEANSYLLQVTMGCSHNQCTFCSFFKDKPFKVRPYEEIEEDILMARKYYQHVPGVFLLDGNVTCLSMDHLRPILKKIKEVLPESRSTNMYGSYRDVALKSVNDLKELKELGVGYIYMGLESGSDKVLADIKKGYSAEEAIEAGQKLYEAGIEFGASIILGIGGAENSEDHISGTLRVLNATNHNGIGLMVLNPQEGTPLFEQIKDGSFQLPSYEQIYFEEEQILRGFNPTKSTFIYSGGFLPGNSVIFGHYSKDRDQILRKLEGRKTEGGRWLKEKIRLNGHL